MAASNYVPANETILFQHNYTNGSLYGQIDHGMVYASNHNNDSHLNLTILANNLASLTFVSRHPSPSLTFPLAQALYDPDNILLRVSCTWPISGQYDLLSRVLFYILMIFSLLFRRYI